MINGIPTSLRHLAIDLDFAIASTPTTALHLGALICSNSLEKGIIQCVHIKMY